MAGAAIKSISMGSVASGMIAFYPITNIHIYPKGQAIPRHSSGGGKRQPTTNKKGSEQGRKNELVEAG
jgi:hypothetical protein